MIHGEDWHWVLGLGIVGAAPMVVVALLEEGVVCGLMKSTADSWSRSFNEMQVCLLTDRSEPPVRLLRV